MNVDHAVPIAVAAAFVLLVVLVRRRRHRREGAPALVRHCLADRDPEVRKAGVFLAAQHGLAPYGRELVDRSRGEKDERVRDALAEVVLRNQWEPADDAALVELRLWAHGHLGHPDLDVPVSTNTEAVEEHGGVMTAVRTAVTNGHSPVEHSSPLVVEAPRVVEAPLVVEAPRARVRPAPTTGRGAIALVTGAGGPAGVAVIRALQAGGYRVVGVDVDGLAAGFRLAHHSALIPPAGDATFVDALCDVAQATAASFLVPTMTEELIALHQARTVLDGAGIAAWVPSPDAVETCLDKWRFAEVLRREGVSTPITNLGSADGVPGAWVVKPRYGRGSRDVLTVDRVDELEWALRRVPQPLVQTRLSGREFTADVLVDRDGTLAGAVPRWRLETRAGCSTKGRTFEDPDLVDELAKVVAAVGLQGPANVQGFIAADGRPTFVEVNPRFSGGLPLSLAAGADLVGEYARAVLGESIRRDRLAFRPGVTMIRRYEEVFE